MLFLSELLLVSSRDERMRCGASLFKTNNRRYTSLSVATGTSTMSSTVVTTEEDDPSSDEGPGKPGGTLHGNSKLAEQLVGSLYNSSGFRDTRSLMDWKLCEIAPKKTFLRKAFRSLHEVPSWIQSDFVSLLSKGGMTPSEIKYVQRLNIRELERLEVAVLSFESAMIICEPELLSNLKPLRHWRKWFIRRCTTKGFDEACKDHKSWLNYLWYRVSRIETMEPMVPPEGAWCINRNGDFLTGVSWIDIGARFGILSKEMATRLATLVTSGRALPTPSKETIEAAELKFYKNMLEDPVELDVQHLSEVRRLSKDIGKECFEFDFESYKNHSHVSLVNSGCLEVARSEGGRAVALATIFRRWASRIPEEDSEVKGLLANYRVVKGQAVWKTVHVPEELWQPRFSAEFGDIELEGIFFPVKFGFDQFTGNQLLEACFDHLIDLGYITRDGKILEEFPVTVSFVGEPGIKSRVVTADMAAVTLILQPLAHVLGAMLANHPFSKSGMTKAYQHFEWAKNFVHPLEVEERFDFTGFGMLTSDMEEATDHLDFEVSRNMLEGFAEGTNTLTQYMKICIELLCSPVRLPEGFMSTRGILMGRPGTKVVLTLHNLVAERKAFELHVGNPSYKEKPWWRNFAPAGDDHIAVGPYDYLMEIGSQHIRNGAALSKTKHGVTRFPNVLVGKFCEKLLVKFPKKTYLKYDPRNYSTNCFVDSIKIRLLSTACKDMDSKETTNPTRGKAKDLFKEVEWLGQSSKFPASCKLAALIFMSRFRRFLPNNPIASIPTQYGGLGITPLGYAFENAVGQLGKCHQAALLAIATGDHRSRELYQVLKQFASVPFVRGVRELSTQDEIIAEIAKISRVLSLDEALSLVPQETRETGLKPHARRIEMRRFAESRGFVSLEKLSVELKRAHTFELLFETASRETRGFKREPPWSKKIRKMEVELSRIIKGRRLTSEQFQIVTSFLSEDPKQNVELSLYDKYISTRIYESDTDMDPISGEKLVARNLEIIPRLRTFDQRLIARGDRGREEGNIVHRRSVQTIDKAMIFVKSNFSKFRHLMKEGLGIGQILTSRLAYKAKVPEEPFRDLILEIRSLEGAAELAYEIDQEEWGRIFRRPPEEANSFDESFSSSEGISNPKYEERLTIFDTFDHEIDFEQYDEFR